MKSNRAPKGVSKRRSIPLRDQPLGVLLTTFANLADAERIGRALVEEKAAVCATVIPGAVSIYAWKGVIERENEVAVLFKTRASRARALARRLGELHPYENPEITVFRAGSLNSDYTSWLRAWVPGAIL
jgi:periplasmic divalent cation tolerance protein